MKRLRLLTALAGSACAILAGALAGPASAAPLSPHPKAAVVPHDGQNTRTGLALSSDTVGLDQEGSLKTIFSVVAIGGGVSGGTVTIRTFLADGTRVDLCSGTVSAGQGSCFLPDGRLPPGSYQLTAHYGGVVGQFEFSDSGPIPLTVATEPTTTTMTTVPQVAYGQESDETFTITTIPRTSGAPTGDSGVISDITLLCGAPLINGVGSCSPNDTALAPGIYQVFGFYRGDSTYAGSDTDNQAITVVRGQATPVLTLSQSKVAVDQQETEELTAHVNPLRGGTPAGMITFKDGTHTICVEGLDDNETAICDLTAGQLAIGSHQLTALYNGDPNFAANGSLAKALTIAAQPTTTALTLSAGKVRAGHEQAEHLTVRVKPRTSGTPADQVTIKAGTTTLCKITLSHATGGCTLSKNKLRPGTYHLTASYAGTTRFAGSASTKKTLTVTKSPAGT